MQVVDSRDKMKHIERNDRQDEDESRWTSKSDKSDDEE